MNLNEFRELQSEEKIEVIKRRPRFNRSRVVCRVNGSSDIYRASKNSHISYLRETEHERLEIIGSIKTVKVWAIPFFGEIQIVSESHPDYSIYEKAGYLIDKYLVK